MIDSLPQFTAHLSRHGHNLAHKFDFTSSTGHLLTLFSDILNAGDTISGKVNMFTRTNPLVAPANVEIEEFIDYFFVPLDMLWSGFGESIFQVNEPYSSMISPIKNNDLPIYNFIGNEGKFTTDLDLYNHTSDGSLVFDVRKRDYYGLDSVFMSFYRNMFHNYINPNFIFKYILDDNIKNNHSYSFPADIFQPNVLPLSLMAYNCVYQNFYRLDDREPFDNHIYNIDSSLYDNDDILVYDNVFDIKYRPLFFDYFTSAKVQPLINPMQLSGGSLNSGLVAVKNYLDNNGISLSGKTGANVNLSQNPTGVNNDNSYGLGTNDIRNMFAVEKILSITNRAKKTYDAQVMAHFGVKVPHDVKHEMQYLGSQRSTLRIGEVISTAGTSDTPLGDMAGKGYGSMSDKSVKFTAPCHGIFIAIYSAVPRIRYYAPLEKHMQISNRLDFFFQPYEKLGMQPIFAYEAFAGLDDYAAGYNWETVSGQYGWQMRYQQYKQRFDKVSPAFADTFVMNSSNIYDISGAKSISFNTWKNWVISRRPYLAHNPGTSEFNGLSEFLASPNLLDDIMSISYGWNMDSDPHSLTLNQFHTKYPQFVIDDDLTHTDSIVCNVASLFYRDPLLHFASIDFKKVNQMSDNTLPDMWC